MRKLILTSVLLLGSISLVLAQSKVAANIYSDYADGEDVLSMSLNYDLVDILDLDLDIDDQMRHISGDVYQVKFIAFGDEASPKKSISAIDQELARSSLKEIDLPKDFDERDVDFIKFYGEKKGDYYSDICMLVLSDEGDTGVFIAVFGKIKIRSKS